MVKNLPANAGDTRDAGLIPAFGRSPGGGDGNPLQYSCLENPTDRGAWRAAVHGVAKSRTQLKRLSTYYVSGFALNRSDKGLSSSCSQSPRADENGHGVLRSLLKA